MRLGGWPTSAESRRVAHICRDLPQKTGAPYLDSEMWASGRPDRFIPRPAQPRAPAPERPHTESPGTPHLASETCDAREQAAFVSTTHSHAASTRAMIRRSGPIPVSHVRLATRYLSAGSFNAPMTLVATTIRRTSLSLEAVKTAPFSIREYCSRDERRNGRAGSSTLPSNRQRKALPLCRRPE